MFSIFSSEFPAAVHGASEDHAIPGGNSTAELVKLRETNIGGFLSHKIPMFFHLFNSANTCTPTTSTEDGHGNAAKMKLAFATIS